MSCLRRQINLGLGLWVEQGPNHFVSERLPPRCVDVEALIEHKHNIILADISNGGYLRTRESPHTREAHIHDRVPVVHLARQKHNFPHESPQKHKRHRHILSADHLRV
jgi:hypothetical protein